jgi:shikimate kinase
LRPSEKKNIALTGFMAVGKTVVGRKVARRLDWRFVDLDRAVEEAEAMKVHEIFERKGEAYFRAAEKRALQRLLREESQVVATGGGAIMDDENLRLLKEKSFLICLTAAPETLLRRSGGAKKRPLLEGEDRKKRIDELLRRREERYAEAHAIIDTDGLSVDQVVEKIIAVVESGV